LPQNNKKAYKIILNIQATR